MANSGEENRVEEAEYESDSVESLFGFTMRRREASDDEDDNDEDANDDGEAEARERLILSNRRFGVGRGDEPDGLGGYDDDHEVSSDKESEELGDAEAEALEDEQQEEDFAGTECERKNGEGEVTEEVKQRIEEEENELLVDPKFGAFYMHDDRFRGRSYGRGRRRHTIEEREPKHEEKWMHDKFEEMNLQVTRTPEDYHPVHHKNKSRGCGYGTANWSKPHDNINNQIYSSRFVKGRGPIKYKPTMRSSSVHPSTKNKQPLRSKKPQGQILNTDKERVFSTGNKQYSKPREKTSSSESARIFSTEDKKPFRYGKFVDMSMTSNTNSVRAFSHISDVETDPLASEKHVFTTNMSSASQMFNSSSPNHFNSLTQKKDVQPEKPFGYVPTSAVPNNNEPKSNELLHGEVAANPVGRDMLYAKKFIHPVSENYLTNPPFQSSVSWPTYMKESTQMMGQRGLFFPTPLSHPLAPPYSHVNNVYPLAYSFAQQMSLESIIQPPLLDSIQRFSPWCGSASQALSEAFPPNSYEPESSKTHTRSKVAVSREGINTLQGRGRCSFLSAGAQGVENFIATGTLFPVMKNGSQHNDGHGDPAVNMPVPGYIPQLQSFVNPEMTWECDISRWPAFPAAAGAAGAAHCSPSASHGGDYHAHSTGQSSSLGVTRYSRMNIDQ
ncbi:hypothetical protein Dsin_015472 [Dipteronia sinensis]|uniref:Btz domain-containing protein n=1 Tax=Dipteronia sinensis TaxID=43782 RepID=A0AAE0ABV7_9ROSI|nr:hypothetical protein Dsin_015472 [Dipteronia sinensis]